MYFANPFTPFPDPKRLPTMHQPVSDDFKVKARGLYTRYNDVQSIFLTDVLPNKCYKYNEYAQHYREPVLIV